ncbi:DUF6708 domain-containing protein, partial [Gilliamella sp. Pas-s27]|uniref:DUF6708 domain-containing protein n=1 Tax=Gilliamella sp. Pas-s27 TaxID=2687311 RepID=UPI00139F8216
DLEKGGNYLTGADQRLLYANDNYCAFIRKTLSDQIFYLSTFFVTFVLLMPAIYMCFSLILDLDLKNESLIYITFVIILITSLVALYISIPEIYQNLFTRRGSPIIFNRKTGKVYINESYFFNFKVLRNPL